MNVAASVRNGARILLALRRLERKKSGNLPSLCEELGIAMRDPKSKKSNTDPKSNTLVYDLCQHLKELRELGLVQFALDAKVFPQIGGKISVTEQWTRLHTALGKPPLEDVAQVSTLARGMALEPVFGRPQKPRQAVDVFVLMPFEEKLRPVYASHITKVAKKLKLKIRRGDDIFSAHPIMEDIWADIHAARVIVADCTGRNANVFYEIGIAHTVGKPVILITQNKDDVPFDVKHMRFIDYMYTPPGMKQFEKTLESTLKDALGM